MPLVVILAAPAALADDLFSGFRTPHADWALFAGANYTDNATLAPHGPTDTIATAGFAGSLYRDTDQLKADVNGTAYYEDYVNGTYPGHPLGDLVGLVSYAFVPKSFSWVVQDSFGQIGANPLQPTTPANRVNGNYFSTGPDGYLRFSADTGLALGARYGRSDFESSPGAQVDNDEVSANLGLVTHLSPVASVSLNADALRLEYRAPGSPRYDQGDLFGRYQATGPRMGLSADAGVSELRQNGNVVHDPLYRLTFFRRLTPSWNLNLSAGREFRNTASALQSSLGGTQVVNGQVVPVGRTALPPGAGGSTADVLLSQSPFRANYARLSFDFVRPRTTFGVSGSIERDQYQFGASGLDRDLYDIGAHFSRQLQPSLAFHASADYARRTPAETEPGDRTKYADVGFDWRAGSMLGVTLAYHREDRSTDAGGFPYTVNRIYLGVSYGPPKHGLLFQAPGTAPAKLAPQS